jgi:hypothetical protein
VYTQKKIAESKEDMKTIFTSNKNQFIEGIKKDKQTYLKFSESEALQDTISKAFVNKQINKFVLIG